MNILPDAPARGALRLSLGHLMLWILATCIALAYEKWRLSSVESERGVFLLYANVRTIIHAPLTGAGLAAFFLCVWRRATGGLMFPTEPGHWLLLVRGAQSVVYCGWELINHLVGPDELLDFLPGWFPYSEMALFDGFLIAFTIVAAVKTSTNAFWPAAFIAMAVNLSSNLLHTMLVVLFTSGAWFMHELTWSIGSRILFSMPAVFAILGAIVDWRARRGHDFIHWVGVFVVVIQAAIEWPEFAIWWYLFRILDVQ